MKNLIIIIAMLPLMVLAQEKRDNRIIFKANRDSLLMVLVDRGFKVEETKYQISGTKHLKRSNLKLLFSIKDSIVTVSGVFNNGVSFAVKGARTIAKDMDVFYQKNYYRTECWNEMIKIAGMLSDSVSFRRDS